MLPREILWMITKLTDEETLKALRLSNTAFEAFATPVLARRTFGSISIHTTTKRLQWFRNVCESESFASHIHSVTFCTIAPSREHIPNLVRKLDTQGPGKLHPMVAQAIGRLSRYLDEHVRLCESGHMIATLEEAFKALLRRERKLHVRITDGREDCFGQHDLHTIAFEPGHVLNGTLYWSESDAMRIMSALTRSQLSPESLSITATPAMAGCSYQSLCSRLDIPNEGGLTHSCDFSSLTSVEIDISSAFSLECTSALASVVGGASNLENVVLRGWDINIVGSFEGRFRDMEAVKPRIAGLRTRGSLQNILPKQGLRNIKLSNLLIEADDLTSFLKANSATLETVRLRSLIICGDIQEFSDLRCDGFPRLRSCAVWGLRNFTGDAIPRWSPPTCC